MYAYAELNPATFTDPLGLTTWPTNYPTVISPFGAPRKVKPHSGVDIRNPKGRTAYATDNGTVINVYSNPKGGNQIRILHPDGSVSGYAHTKANVKVGQKVEEGDAIGYSDGSGVLEAPHLHYTFRKCLNCEKSDPMEYLKDADMPKCE